MKSYVEETEELATFPFSFAKGLPSFGFYGRSDDARNLRSFFPIDYIASTFCLFTETTVTVCIYPEFLKNIGVFDQGLWRREGHLEIPGMLHVCDLLN